MRSYGSKRDRRPQNGRLAIWAVLLWVVAGALIAVFFVTGTEDSSTDSAAAQTTAEAGKAPVSTTVTIAPSSTSTTSTSTTSTTSTSTTSTTIPPLTIAAGGDVLGDRGVGLFMDKHGGPAVLEEVRPYLEDAHLAFINLECPISDQGSAVVGKEYTFRGRTALTEGLVSAGIDMVSLANNHTLDYGQKAFIDTLRRLDKAGIAHAGGGVDKTDAALPAIMITPAGTVAFLAFTEIIPGGFTATADRGGVNPITPDRKKVVADIEQAAERVDYVVVSVHWGVEYDPYANQRQRDLAHQMVDAGADLVLGHHPHVIQGLELYEDRLIAYSLGDFVFDHYSRETGEAFVLRVTMTPEGPPGVEVVPVYLDDNTGVPALVTGQEADRILQRLIRLSDKLGLELTQTGDRVLLDARPPTPSPDPSPAP